MIEVGPRRNDGSGKIDLRVAGLHLDMADEKGASACVPTELTSKAIDKDRLRVRIFHEDDGRTARQAAVEFGDVAVPVQFQRHRSADRHIGGNWNRAGLGDADDLRQGQIAGLHANLPLLARYAIDRGGHGPHAAEPLRRNAGGHLRAGDLLEAQGHPVIRNGTTAPAIVYPQPPVADAGPFQHRDGAGMRRKRIENGTGPE